MQSAIARSQSDVSVSPPVCRLSIDPSSVAMASVAMNDIEAANKGDSDGGIHAHHVRWCHA